MNWKPISEIPELMKDGRPVWVRWNEGGSPLGFIRHSWAYYRDGMWLAADTDERIELTHITHYAELED